MLRALKAIWLVIACFLLNGCCTTVKDLRPAFEANKQNLQDLRGNVITLLDLLDKCGIAVIDARIELMRTKIADNLLTDFLDLGIDPSTVTASSVERALSNQASTVGKRFSLFRDAMNAATDLRRDELRYQYPVFASILDLRVSSQQIADDYVMLIGARSSPNVSELRSKVADKYPTLQNLRSIRERFAKALADYREIMVQKQLGLALEHADLFVFAAESNLNIEKAFSSVIGDKALQSEILGAVHDPKIQSTLSESFDLVTKLINNPQK
jgi:hypothetical protein